MIERHVLSDCIYTEFQCGGVRDDGSTCFEPLEKRFIHSSREMGLNEIPLDKQHASQVGLETSDMSDQRDTDSIPVALCPHELIECPNGCNQPFMRFQLNQHIDTECANIQDKCPVCAATMSRRDLPNHLNVCPDMMTPCSAAEFGCVWVGKRHVLTNEHTRMCRFISFAPVLKKQDTRMSKLEQENKILRQKLDRVMTFVLSRNMKPEGLRPSPEDASTDQERNPTSLTSSSTTTSFTDSDLLHLFMEGERFREEIDRVNTTLGEMEMRHGMSLLQESFRTGEEISNLRGLISSLRNQMHFLLTERRAWAITQQNPGSQVPPQSQLNAAANMLFPTAPVLQTSPELEPSTPGPFSRVPRRLSDISRQDIKL